jgi:probable F420-dependent oxidoreductase
VPSVNLGVFIFPTDQTIGPDRFAREAEARGFESVWFPEHTHVPAERTTPFKGGGDLPPEYYRPFDPFVALAAAAAVTTDIRLGTSICLVAQRDTILLAKEVSSLDVLSAGRFELGVGYGWNIEEMTAHGVDPKLRIGLVRERILAMKQLWANEVGEFKGELVEVLPSYQWPKPLQQPHPSILLGGAGGPKLVRNIVELADAWMSLPGGSVSTTIEAIGAECARVGRDPDSISVTAWGPPKRPEVLEKYQNLGIARVILTLPPATSDEILPELDQIAGFIPQFAD